MLYLLGNKNKYMTIKIKENPGVVETIIDMLSHIDVDGETMEHIIKQVGMEQQILRQLIMSSPIEWSVRLLNEKVNLPM
jgi:hypothetical protein